MTSIGSGAFSGCSGLVYVEFHCKEIESWFSENTSIKEVIIGDEVTSIGSKAFEYCSGLTSITIGNRVTTIGESAFRNCSSLSSITIPNNVTNIEDEAFRGCTSLTCIILGNSVTTIGNGAFRNCSGLTNITIPSSVTTIGSWAFFGCNNLTSVKAEMPFPITITQGVFSNRANATLYVKQGCKAAYMAADYWKEFKEIIEIGSDDEAGISHNTNNTKTNSHWYTLDGRKLDKKPTAKGMYVRDNRKVVVK